MNESIRVEIERYWTSPEQTQEALFGEAERKAARNLPPLGGYFNKDGRLHYPAPADSEEYHKIEAAEHQERQKAEEAARESVIQEMNRFFQEHICVKWQYCEKRKVIAGDGFNLAVAIVDGLISMGIQCPVPLTAAVVYLVRNQMLDRLCGCKV